MNEFCAKCGEEKPEELTCAWCEILQKEAEEYGEEYEC